MTFRKQQQSIDANHKIMGRQHWYKGLYL